MADNLYSYDSFAKLNIMSEVAPDGSPVVPQIMFDLAKNGSKRTWNGDRLDIIITFNCSVNLGNISYLGTTVQCPQLINDIV